MEGSQLSRTTVYSSYPVDHYDPQVRNSVDGKNKLVQRFYPFQDLRPDAKILRRLGDLLGPDKRDIKSANKVINQIRIVLTGKECQSIVSVDRICVSGSYGKHTALAKFDVDLVVFVNKEYPAFELLLKKLELFLPKALNPTKQLEMGKTSRYSLQFLYDGFQIDLLLATNLAAKIEVSNPGRSMTVKEYQYEYLITKLKSMSPKRRQKELRSWSAGFAESTVEFMKEQSAFCNAAVRICKLWKEGCVVTNKTFPLWFTSFLVEILAVEFGNKELREHPIDASIQRVLQNFLEALSKPYQLKIIPTESKYNHVDVPEDVLKLRPLVLDPVNPFNNVALQMGDWDTIRLLALATLDSLERCSEDSQLRMKEIFSPRFGTDMSKLYAWCNFRLQFVMDGSFLRTLGIRKVKDLNGKRNDPIVNWRKQLDPKQCADEAKHELKGMFQSLVNISTTAMLHRASDERNENNKEVSNVSNFVDGMLLEVFGFHKHEWSPSSLSHEDHDITLTFGQIPIPSLYANDLQYIQLILSFNICETSLYRIAYDIKHNRERSEWEYEDEDDNEAYY